MKEKKILNEMSVKTGFFSVRFLPLRPYCKCPIAHKEFNIDPINLKS